MKNLKIIFMKHGNFIKRVVLFNTFFLILIPRVFALAGFSERSSDLIYNDYARLHWGYPSDGCDAGYPDSQYCFTIWAKNELKNPSYGELRQISVPPAPNFPMALAERSYRKHLGNGLWIIYDLKSKGIILETENFEEALNEWKKFGFTEPTFANAKNLSNYFEETEESKTKNNEDFPMFLMIFITVIIFTAFIVLFAHWKFFTALFLLAAIVIFYARNRKKFYT